MPGFKIRDAGAEPLVSVAAMMKVRNEEVGELGMDWPLYIQANLGPVFPARFVWLTVRRRRKRRSGGKGGSLLRWRLS